MAQDVNVSFKDALKDFGNDSSSMSTGAKFFGTGFAAQDVVAKTDAGNRSIALVGVFVVGVIALLFLVRKK